MQNQQIDCKYNSLPIPPILNLPPPTLSPYTHFCTEKQIQHFNLVNGQQSTDFNEIQRIQLESKISTNLKKQNNHFTHQSIGQGLEDDQIQRLVNITKYIKCEKCQKWLLNEELQLHMTFHPSQINQRLYLGDRFGSANKKQMLQRLKITHIVNAALQLPNCFQETQQISYLKLQLQDKMEEDVIQPCLLAAEFIHNSLNEKQHHKVFVHCAMGKSRSVAAILIYLMKYQNMGFKESLQFVKQKRRIAKPNPSYLRQLQDFELLLKEQKQKQIQ